MFRFVFLAFVLWPPLAYSSERAGVDRPEWKIGDSWVHRRIDLIKNADVATFDRRVVSVSEQSYVLSESTSRSGEPEKPDATARRQVDSSTLTFEDPHHVSGQQVMFEFPLEHNKTWRYQRSRSRPPGGQELTSRAKVIGWEKVTVPAGIFDALKVVHSTHYVPNDRMQFASGSEELTLWYVPSIKWYVKREWYHIHGGRLWDHNVDELIVSEAKQ